jgi:hypothetical protein
VHTYTAFMGTNVGVYVRPWSLSIDICERKIASGYGYSGYYEVESLRCLLCAHNVKKHIYTEH